MMTGRSRREKRCGARSRLKCFSDLKNLNKEDCPHGMPYHFDNFPIVFIQISSASNLNLMLIVAKYER
jgi:hypothetical protein